MSELESPPRIRRKPDAKIQALLTHIAAGMTPAFIALRSGCSELELNAALNKAPPEALREARAVGIAARLASGQAAIAGARNTFELARAREAFKAEMWLAECEFPEKWRQIGSTRPVAVGAAGEKEAPKMEIVLTQAKELTSLRSQ